MNAKLVKKVLSHIAVATAVKISPIRRHPT